jgi:hypothetical protein
MLDRFRSFNHVHITETGLIHTPWHEWNKDFVLLLTMGSPDPVNADPVIELFDFVTKILGEQNRLHFIKATRVAVSRHISKSEEELRILYEKMKLPLDLVKEDYERNSQILRDAAKLGEDLSG